MTLDITPSWWTARSAIRHGGVIVATIGRLMNKVAAASLVTDITIGIKRVRVRVVVVEGASVGAIEADRLAIVAALNDAQSHADELTKLSHALKGGSLRVEVINKPNGDVPAGDQN